MFDGEDYDDGAHAPKTGLTRSAGRRTETLAEAAATLGASGFVEDIFGNVAAEGLAHYPVVNDRKQAHIVYPDVDSRVGRLLAG